MRYIFPSSSMRLMPSMTTFVSVSFLSVPVLASLLAAS